MNTKYKSISGITLTALIITIIILLILAAVGIGMMSGRDGILIRALNAAKQINQKSLKEQVDLAIAGIRMQNDYKYNKDNAKTEIEKIPGVGTEGITDNNDGTLTVKKDEIIVNVDKDGNTTIAEQTVETPTPPAERTGDALAIKQEAEKTYGALVENYGVTYDTTTGATNRWRIFYADGEDVAEEDRHIYLIANDYIHYNYAPKSTNNTIYNNTNYILSMKNVYRDYTGSESIDSSIGNRWLSRYLNYNTNSSSINRNIRAVAYILDTSIWNTIYKNNYADYAIGSPTLEMFCKSYKDTHPSKYVECEAETSTNGYNVKWSDNETYSTYITGCKQGDFNGIYIKSDTSKANAVWLASPSAFTVSNVMCAYYNGYVNSNGYNSSGVGLRPIVSLKSNIQLEDAGNGNYRIK